MVCKMVVQMEGLMVDKRAQQMVVRKASSLAAATVWKTAEHWD